MTVTTPGGLSEAERGWTKYVPSHLDATFNTAVVIPLIIVPFGSSWTALTLVVGYVGTSMALRLLEIFRQDAVIRKEVDAALSTSKQNNDGGA